MGDFGSVNLLLISLCSSSILLVIIFFIAWLSFGRKAYALIWSLTFLVASIQWASNLVGADPYPSPEIYWIVVNLLALTVISLAFLGHRQRVGLKTSPLSLIGAALILEAGIIWFTSFDSHQGLRSALLPMYAFVMMLWVSKIILVNSPRNTPTVWGAGLVVFLFALSQLAVAWAGFQQGVHADAYYADLHLTILFTVLPSAFVGMGLFTVLLLASDMAEELRLHSIMDLLTGTLNRRGIEEAIKPAFAQARRYGQPLSIVMTDIDFFKTINDDYGHVTGDNALALFAQTLRDELRAEDIVGRMGGEEFIMVLPNTDLEKGRVLIERLRHIVASTLITTNDYRFNMTASFGLSILQDMDDDMNASIHRADQALYKSKELGRNRVEVIES